MSNLSFAVLPEQYAKSFSQQPRGDDIPTEVFFDSDYARSTYRGVGANVTEMIEANSANYNVDNMFYEAKNSCNTVNRMGGRVGGSVTGAVNGTQCPRVASGQPKGWVQPTTVPQMISDEWQVYGTPSRFSDLYNYDVVSYSDVPLNLQNIREGMTGYGMNPPNVPQSSFGGAQGTTQLSYAPPQLAPLLKQNYYANNDTGLFGGPQAKGYAAAVRENRGRSCVSMGNGTSACAI